MLSIEQIRPELTWRLRRDVLYPSEPLYAMEMEEDNDGYHFGAFADNQLIAVVSVFLIEDDCQFRKFAVVPQAQGQGVGQALLAYITDFATSEGCKRLWCNARLSAIGFYVKYGLKQTGNAFTRNGVDYEIVEKLIN
ncbi:GNAT family N-acetyltransferase [Mucilaginibacter calamicampi]|uniref:GNAT family N-acetyltransferase n=1 Tax=Mucilaginibacter calamicampi TaxID=1302352 RepID=A0ABW2YZ76_9SPHI